MSSRRDFIKTSSLATCSMMLPGFLFNQQCASNTYKGKKLVIIQLSGGNDGLNTFVPYSNDNYYRQRQHLAIQQKDVLQIADGIGLNKELEGLRGIFDAGDLSLLHAVGYPNPNRSHFRSMDIWQTGSSSKEYLQTGWLGRYLDANCQQNIPAHHALEIDDTLGLAVKGKIAKGMAIKNPGRLFRQSKDRHLQYIQDKYGKPTDSVSSLDYMYKTMAESTSSAQYLYEQSKIFRSKTTYPNSKLGKQLKQVSELICSGTETQVYYLSLAGFDTHANQINQHGRLLKQYGDAVAAFVKDLKNNHQWEDTLVLTFSEFGRRLAENGSRGTDHGKANALWLMGGSLQSQGIYNELPELAAEDLDDGDLKWQIDFRQVYAEILEKWLQTDSKAILGKSFDTLGLIRPA